MGSVSGPPSGPCETVKSPTESTKNAKNVVLSGTWHYIVAKKDTCLQPGSRNKKAEHRFTAHQLGTRTVGGSNFLPLVTCPQNTVSINSGVTSPVQQAGEFTYKYD